MIIIAIIVAFIGGLAIDRLVQRRYRQRWLASTKLINSLQDELAEDWGRLEAPEVSRGRVIPRISPVPSQLPWRVSARTIKGITSVYAKRGLDFEELERVPKSSSTYDDDLAKALIRATRTVELRNGK